MEKILKKRPLCQYYLWKSCKKIMQDLKGKDQIVQKQLIGQLKAERKDLEKLELETISLHISSLAFLEEYLSTLSVYEVNELMSEVQNQFGNMLDNTK
ncbi:hypothetical protein [Enterococcus faecalis]|uniref:hypothetical protein n=1 Tax=Enterococcus faecalis TaxID=1351 RepID=UPI001A9773CF|nr:hypothetical protein [Enterococcus faecalis]MBO1137182.1 hypothetical protein [Enterococcus faecalis]